MRDITDWVFTGHGEKSTLEKEELLSPDDIGYIMKYPRQFDGNRVNWEDVNEILAAEIAKLLELTTVEAEVAYRHGRRGCLMLHFLTQFEADQGEPGAPLIQGEFQSKYKELQLSNSKGIELVEQAFDMIENFSYFPSVKVEFISMNVFDILIGNQDRHSYNWQVLFKGNSHFFGPLYDNGVSLGWQLADRQLELLINDDGEMEKYYNKMKVKAGLFESKQPPLKASQVLSYCNDNFPVEMRNIQQKLERFDTLAYNHYIDQFPLISDTRKEFLKTFITYRKDRILCFLREEE